mmetsp:Transcript_63621/g.189580  ORF Transcript_63621/g.189580 Transcript_63621/m.189580 type:complete len:205 (-) Transcript_63621:98-712(-)
MGTMRPRRWSCHTRRVRNDGLGLVQLAQREANCSQGGCILTPRLLLPDACEAEVGVGALRQDPLLEAPDTLGKVIALVTANRTGHVLCEVLRALPEMAQGRAVARNLQRVAAGGVLREEGVRQELTGGGQEQEEAPVQWDHCSVPDAFATVRACSLCGLPLLRVHSVCLALCHANGVGSPKSPHRAEHHLPHSERMPAAFRSPA